MRPLSIGFSGTEPCHVILRTPDRRVTVGTVPSACAGSLVLKQTAFLALLNASFQPAVWDFIEDLQKTGLTQIHGYHDAYQEWTIDLVTWQRPQRFFKDLGGAVESRCEHCVSNDQAVASVTRHGNRFDILCAACAQ
jgi:hypothetical protein